MAGVDLFAPKSEDMVREALLRAKDTARGEMRQRYQMAVDYLEGRQLDDVETELHSRYERTQSSGKQNQVIAAQVVPLTERYIAEAANAYNRPVTRKLVNEAGDVDEDNTAILADMLRDCRYDERMHRVDQLSILLGSCGLWYQAKAGSLRPVVTYPHDIYPVSACDDWADPADQDDYAGFVVELFQDSDDAGACRGKHYAFLTPAETAFYAAKTPFRPEGPLTVHPSPYTWPQVVDTDDMRGTVESLPLQMLTVWHKQLPVGELITDTDPDIALANRELNLQLSVLLDTISHQGWAHLLFNLLNPESPPPTMSAGPRNAFALGPDESASMLSSPVNYTDLVGALQIWIRLIAVAHRQSPNDFSTEGSAATSGFAKLVDSLPKIEARQERVRRLAASEATLAWPRIAAVGNFLGKFRQSVEQLAALRMVTEFAPVEFPKSIDERTKEEDHDIKHGMTTPAKLLAKRKGIPIEEAEAEIEDNKGGAQLEPQPQAVQPQPGNLLGQLIARRNNG